MKPISRLQKAMNVEITKQESRVTSAKLYQGQKRERKVCFEGKGKLGKGGIPRGKPKFRNLELFKRDNKSRLRKNLKIDMTKLPKRPTVERP